MVPPPPDAVATMWEWTTRLAEGRMNVIELPDAFRTTPAPERVPLIREANYACMRQIAEHRGRRH